MPDTFPMALSEYLDYLPGYDLTDELSETLEVARNVIDSENYFMQGFVFPHNGLDTINGLDTFEGLIDVPAHSILIFMTGSSFVSERGALIPSTAGFKFQMYENGSKQNLFGRTFARQDVLGQYSNDANGLAPDNPFGAGWLNAPLISIPPGRINLELTNLATVPALIQLYFNFAVPITRETLSQSVQRRSQ